MDAVPTVLHLDLDAFFAAVEQRDKPSLRGRPVVVGGLGRRGVVATASYEARRFGIGSAMAMAEARRRCPHAAFLGGRFAVYREASAAVMTLLRSRSTLVEPLSLDEAYVDLSPVAATLADVTETAVELKQAVTRVTRGLTASVGIATSKLVAKIASDLDKPDGFVVVAPGRERELLAPMGVAALPGVGPATAQRLRRTGVATVADLARVDRAELVRLVGDAHGRSLYRLARADDDRRVQSSRESKSVSVEDTFETDLVDRRLLEPVVTRHADRVCARLRAARVSGRTVTVKARAYDFATHTRSLTLAAPTDDPQVIGGLARRLLAEMDVDGGVRLLGVGVSGLADWVQDDLFEQIGAVVSTPPAGDAEEPATDPTGSGPPVWVPGADVVHTDHGPGWVWGAGVGRVTVRFETADTGPGPVRTLAADDPDLRLHQPVDPRAEDPATEAG